MSDSEGPKLTPEAQAEIDTLLVELLSLDPVTGRPLEPESKSQDDSTSEGDVELTADEEAEALKTIAGYHLERALSTAVQAAMNYTNRSESELNEAFTRAAAELFGLVTLEAYKELLAIAQEQGRLLRTLVDD